MSNSQTVGVCICMIVTFIVGVAVGAYGKLIIKSDNRLNSEREKLIKECEKSLPRDQHCFVKLIAEVKKEEFKND